MFYVMNSGDDSVQVVVRGTGDPAEIWPFRIPGAETLRVPQGRAGVTAPRGRPLLIDASIQTGSKQDQAVCNTLYILQRAPALGRAGPHRSSGAHDLRRLSHEERQPTPLCHTRSDQNTCL